MDRCSFAVRVTGVLVDGGRLLLVRQRVDESRDWSLPGGRAEAGEALADALIREMKEETGLDVRINRLLYLCERPDATMPLLHISFLLDYVGGAIGLPTNEFDENPISDVRFVPFADLQAHGFSAKFVSVLQQGFPGAGQYMGPKANIGL